MFTLIDVDIDHCVSFTQDLCRLQRGGRMKGTGGGQWGTGKRSHWPGRGGSQQFPGDEGGGGRGDQEAGRRVTVKLQAYDGFLST